jgi:hypothetical protein
MNYNTLISIIALIFCVSCKGKFSVADKGTINGTEYRVFPFDPKEKYPLFVDAKPTTLTNAEIKAIEEIVGAQILELINTHNARRHSKSTYVRQYVAGLNSKGEKHIWINIFCSNNFTPWKEGVIEVADGGDCAFQMKVNLTTKVVYQFRLNGFA